MDRIKNIENKIQSLDPNKNPKLVASLKRILFKLKQEENKTDI